ncbi:LacI family DNA-binding transcriptional regulator [Microlunatus soli]|uniref:LacI family DNA-binding transcriptional regulator n=1 Tax=Microlunatus soli TaxID=630515 RepID=UPI0018D40EED|nr:LacI family DNA-binding transcriptional regulator [Microlunatus soli]
MASNVPTGKVTVSDIAAETGVSVATVSKVLNGRADVAESTRERIQTALDTHGYVKPPRAPSSPRKAKRPGLIDIVFTDPGSPWATEMIRGVEKASRDQRISVVVSVLDEEHSHDRWVDTIASRGSVGVILGSVLADDAQRRIAELDVPTVMVDPMGDFASHVPSFGAGNWGGGLAATEHLLELGHRRIGTITGPMRYLCSQARLAGYRAALERAGITPDQQLIGQGDFHYDSAERAASALLELDDPPTAIFAGNDEQALGVYAAAQRHGLSVPDELSVIGFDDVPMSQWVLPALTTVRAPIPELARLAVRAILDRTEQADGPPVARTELPTTLVVRSSTAAAPNR